MDFPPAGHLRYQLFHRAASAVVECRGLRGQLRAMIVHSFSPEKAWFEDYGAFVDIRRAPSVPATHPCQSSSTRWASAEITPATSSNADLSYVTRHRSMMSRPNKEGMVMIFFRWLADAQLDFVAVQRFVSNKGHVRRLNEVLGNSTDPQRRFLVFEPVIVNPHPLSIEGHQQGRVSSGIETNDTLPSFPAGDAGHAPPCTADRRYRRIFHATSRGSAFAGSPR